MAINLLYLIFQQFHQGRLYIPAACCNVILQCVLINPGMQFIFNAAYVKPCAHYLFTVMLQILLATFLKYFFFFFTVQNYWLLYQLHDQALQTVSAFCFDNLLSTSEYLTNEFPCHENIINAFITIAKVAGGGVVLRLCFGITSQKQNKAMQ